MDRRPVYSKAAVRTSPNSPARRQVSFLCPTRAPCHFPVLCGIPEITRGSREAAAGGGTGDTLHHLLFCHSRVEALEKTRRGPGDPEMRRLFVVALVVVLLILLQHWDRLERYFSPEDGVGGATTAEVVMYALEHLA